MRIDKFLKVSRVIKRRTVAAEACSGGRIEINGKAAKPAKEVKPGDVVTVSFGSSSLTFEVLNVEEKQTKQSLCQSHCRRCSLTSVSSASRQWLFRALHPNESVRGWE